MDEISPAQPPPELSALVVDDSLPVRVQMREVLSSIASRVNFAETGERALELIDTHRYSIIFLDGTLPDEDAYEICGRIKKHPLQREAVAVMLTSDSSSRADRVMGMIAGFDNYLVKPLQRTMFNDLAAAIVRPAACI
jgi:DNA-binding response OmpR family regulator